MMMNPNGNKTIPCPETEDLSAFFDGELNANASRKIAAHLESCEHCRVIVQQFKSMERNFSDSLARIPIPSDLEQSILKKMRNGNPTDTNVQWSIWSPWMIRIAALIIMASFFIYLVFDNKKVQSLQQRHASQPTNQEEKTYHQKSIPVLTSAQNNLIKRVSTADSLSQGALSSPFTLDVNPRLLQQARDAISILPAGDAERHEYTERIFRIEGVSATELYPQLRNAICELEFPGVSCEVTRLESNDNIVTAVIRIHSHYRLTWNLNLQNSQFEFRLDETGEDSTPVDATCKYTFICVPSGK